MTAPASPHLTTEQLAERWHTTPNAVRIRRCRGKAPKPIKNGRKLLWPIARVEAWERASAA